MQRNNDAIRGSGSGNVCPHLRITAEDLSDPQRAPGRFSSITMRWCVPVHVFCLLGALVGCSSPSAPSSSQSVPFQFDFAQGPQGWTSGFANYYLEFASHYELAAFYGALKVPLFGSALEVFGHNASSTGLFVYYKRQIFGLRAGGAYVASISEEIATAQPNGCPGVSGPADDVYVKSGANALEPITLDKSIPEGFTAVTLNLDLGLAESDTVDALSMGNIANSFQCGDPGNVWQLKTLPARTQRVTAASDGTIWLFTGMQFGAFEGRVGIYFTKFNVTFTPTS